MSMFKSGITAKILGTWIVIGSSLLCVAALSAGILLENRTGLAMTGWGLLFAPIAVTAIIVRFGLWKKVIKHILTFLPRKHRVSNLATNETGAHLLNSRYHQYEDYKPGWEQDYEDMPAWNTLSQAGAHFNWDTGEYETRGSGGDFDPPYDPMKG